MSSELFRVVGACIALVAVVVAACLFRYELVLNNGDRFPRGYLLDRWTGALTYLEKEDQVEVKRPARTN